MSDRKGLRLHVLGTGCELATVASPSYIDVREGRLPVPLACTSTACRSPSGTPLSLYGISVVMEGCSARMRLYAIQGISPAQTEEEEQWAYSHKVPFT
jgi:hypothetical protein